MGGEDGGCLERSLASRLEEQQAPRNPSRLSYPRELGRRPFYRKGEIVCFVVRLLCAHTFRKI